MPHGTFLDYAPHTIARTPQNIDMLDVLAGVSEDRMIECHGHFRTASCTRCKLPYNGGDCKRIIVEEKRAPTCTHCRGYVKPDIVFFGENLPTRFHRLVRQDTKKADLLLVMGTCELSLSVVLFFVGGLIRRLMDLLYNI
jgi:NAD-dependent SIR2 family protein deacetylase